MGVMSRRVIPVCADMFVCCPGLRTRSRRPVKRYKKLMEDIYPHTQEEAPNDRKIGKLCEYASKNPLRIPKIANSLEQKAYKDLRHEHFGSIRVIVRTYVLLFSTCKSEMSLFATSALNVIRVLLDQTRHDDMRILGCHMVYDFINCQVDGTYTRNLDGLTPKLCSLAQELGELQQQNRLRAAGLQALSAMVWFMGAYTHANAEFDVVLSVALENYPIGSLGVGDDVLNNISSQKEGIYLHDPSTPGRSEMETPGQWALVCVQNMVCLAKEATSVRRILEAMFQYFDTGDHWSFDHGLAMVVLQNLLTPMEKSGRDHLLLTCLVKHLDNKNVSEKHQIKLAIVKIVVLLAQQSKSKATLLEVGAMGDLFRHLRKGLQLSEEAPNSIEAKQSRELQEAFESCMTELARRVEDLSCIFEMMAISLENLATSAQIARATVGAIAILACIVANLPYTPKGFPEALFHQLLQAMAHPDVQTRIGAHRIFMLLVASPPSTNLGDKIKGDMSFKDRFGEEGKRSSNISGNLAYNIIHSMSRAWRTSSNLKEIELIDARLSGEQVALVISSLWVQSNLADNLLSNYEAIAQTFGLVVSYARERVYGHEIHVRAFQMAFSLRSVALSPRDSLAPSRRRCLLILATAMLIRLAKLNNLQSVATAAKEILYTFHQDSYLELSDENLIKVLSNNIEQSKFGSQEDDAIALESLASIKLDEKHSNEALASMIAHNMSSSDTEQVSLRDEMLQMFSVDDASPFGSNLHRNGVYPFCNGFSRHSGPFVEAFPVDDDLFSDTSCTDLSQFISKAPIRTTSNVIGVSQLLQSALQTAGQVASASISDAPLSYNAMASQCEAFGSSTRRKMSIWMKLEAMNDNILLNYPDDEWFQKGWVSDSGSKSNAGSGNSSTVGPSWATEVKSDPWPAIQLPPSSSYDNFLRAANYQLVF